MKLVHTVMSHIENPVKCFIALQKITATICILIPAFLRGCDKDEFNPIDINSTALKQVSICRDRIEIDTFIKHYRIDSVTQLIMKNCSSKVAIINATKIDKHYLGFRASLSNYAYSSNSYLFGMLYCMAAMLFIYNGVIHIKIFKNKSHLLSDILNTRGSWCYLSIGASLILVILNPMHDREVLHYIFSILFFGLNIYAIAFLPNHDVSNNSKLKRYIIAAAAAIALIILILMKAVLWGEWVSLAIISYHLFLVGNSVQRRLKFG